MKLQSPGARQCAAFGWMWQQPISPTPPIQVQAATPMKPCAFSSSMQKPKKKRGGFLEVVHASISVFRFIYDHIAERAIAAEK